jgi:hypothetical protein
MLLSSIGPKVFGLLNKGTDFLSKKSKDKPASSTTVAIAGMVAGLFGVSPASAHAVGGALQYVAALLMAL